MMTQNHKGRLLLSLENSRQRPLLYDAELDLIQAN